MKKITCSRFPTYNSINLNKYNNKIHNFSYLRETDHQQENFISTIDNTTKILTNPYHNVKNPNYLYFLGGFVEGEGSNSVSISVGKNFKYGVNLQPVFNVSQHENGINILYSFKELFGAGSVVEKSGSPQIWVYTLKGYKQIIEKVIPFLETYVQPFSCKKKEYSIFKQLVLDSAAGYQKNQDTLIEMVKLAYIFQGKGKMRKRKLEEVLLIINDKSAYFNNIEH